MCAGASALCVLSILQSCLGRASGACACHPAGLLCVRQQVAPVAMGLPRRPLCVFTFPLANPPTGPPALLPLQAAALAMFAHSLHNRGPRASSKPSKGRSKTASPSAAAPAAAAHQPLPTLLRVLSALAHPARAVRAAAVGAVEALAETAPAWWPEGGLAAEGWGGEDMEVTQEQLGAILAAVAAQRAAIEADGEACETLLARALGGAPGETAPAAPATASKKGKAGGSGVKRKGGAVAADGEGQPLSLALTPPQVDSLGHLLLAQLPEQRGPAGLQAAELALRCLPDWAPPGALLRAAWRLLGGVAAAAAGQQAALAAQQAQVAAQAVGCYTAPAASQLLSENEAQGSEALHALLGLLAPGQQPSEVRLAALRTLSAELYQALPEDTQREAVVVSVVCFAGLVRAGAGESGSTALKWYKEGRAVLPQSPSQPLLSVVLGCCSSPHAGSSSRTTLHRPAHPPTHSPTHPPLHPLTPCRPCCAVTRGTLMTSAVQRHTPPSQTSRSRPLCCCRCSALLGSRQRRRVGASRRRLPPRQGPGGSVAKQRPERPSPERLRRPLPRWTVSTLPVPPLTNWLSR